jgi:hypothetical protein
VQPVELVIEDGTMHLQLPVGDHPLRLRSDGIFLRAARGERIRRVVLGRTVVALDGEEIVDIAAVAADLDTRRRHRPTRVAVLGGLVRAPGHAPGALLGVHSATITERAGGGYDLRLTGKPAGKGTGAISLRAQLGRDGRPAGPAAATLKLRSVDLTRLASLMEPLGLRTAGTRVGGDFTIAEDRGLYRARIQLQAENLRVHHPLISRNLVGPFGCTATGEIRLDPARHRIRIQTLDLTTGALRSTLTGTVTSSDGQARVAFDLAVPETPCQKLLSSLPPGLAPKLEGMGLEGRLGLTARLVIDGSDVESSDVDVDVSPLTCKVVADPPDADPRALLGEVNVRVSGARGTGMTWPLGPSNPDYRTLEKISRHVRSAFIVAEDSRFFHHRGFDGPQLRRAFLSNLKEGRLLRGASTISQQLVKNTILDHERSLSRKLQEAVLTWRLEQVVPKNRILELYLNVVEMGPGIYGVTQAARHYFGKLPSALSPLQAAHLAALTPSPRHLAQRLRDGDPGPAWFERVRMLLRMMRRSGAITTEAQQQAQAERLSLLKH